MVNGKRAKLSVTLEEIEDMRESYGGLCLECGYEQSQCEPDVRGGTCDACTKQAVYGAEELIFEGVVK